MIVDTALSLPLDNTVSAPLPSSPWWPGDLAGGPVEQVRAGHVVALVLATMSKSRTLGVPARTDPAAVGTILAEVP